MFVFCLMPFLLACGSGEDQGTIKKGSICAILAHPDDETIIAGTLAMLSSRGSDVTVVYVTSGDDGPDHTGMGLHGELLGAEREKEALNALSAIGIKYPPVFFRFPDGHVYQYVDSVEQKLMLILDSINPEVVIGFGPDGITGDWDHKAVGKATNNAFNQTESGCLLLHMAITKPFPPFYANGVAVPKKDIDVQVKVSAYSKQRSQAVGAHHTQFNRRARSAYKAFVFTMRKEKFIIARNYNGDVCLKEYFNE